MRKFMKYEIKGSYRFILGIIAILTIASIIFSFNMASMLKNGRIFSKYPTAREMVIVLAYVFVVIGSFVTAFIYIVNSFRKELYENRGYLTFSLPLTGKKIVGGKLLVGTLWIIILSLIVIVSNVLLANLFYKNDLGATVKSMLKYFSHIFVKEYILALLSVVLVLILVYFSMAIGKVTVRNKNIGGLWFVIFLIIQGIANYLIYGISKILPYYLDLKTFKLFHGIELGIMNITKNQGHINIFCALFTVFIGIGAFLATGYIIEKKIDL